MSNQFPEFNPDDFHSEQLSGEAGLGEVSENLGAIQPASETCMDNCVPGGILKWVPTWPQGHLSVSSGFIGQRMAYFTGTKYYLDLALQQIYNSHWPGTRQWCKDCLPVDIQWGPSGNEQQIQTFGNIANADIGKRLEWFNEYRIVVTYQLLPITNPWPMSGKPAHPRGTVLYYQVRGGGEMMQIDPTGIRANLSTTTGIVEQAPGQPQAIDARIKIPLSEYHITCDRITDTQLCQIMTTPWKCREATVNCDKFMNEPEGTLLFDSWSLEPTYAPDITNPRRWRLTCVLKCRQLPQIYGNYPENETVFKYPVGWNHDYKRGTGVNSQLAWRFIAYDLGASWRASAADTPHGAVREPFGPRYPYFQFYDLFCFTGQCSSKQEASAACNVPCSDVEGCSEFFVTHPWEAASEDGDKTEEQIEQAIAQIVEDARKAPARAAIRQQQQEAAGWKETWPRGIRE